LDLKHKAEIRKSCSKFEIFLLNLAMVDSVWWKVTSCPIFYRKHRHPSKLQRPEFDSSD